MIRPGDDNYISTRTRSLKKKTTISSEELFQAVPSPGEIQWCHEPQRIMRSRMFLEFIQRVTTIKRTA